MAELVDAPALGAGTERCGSSSLPVRTTNYLILLGFIDLLVFVISNFPMLTSSRNATFQIFLYFSFQCAFRCTLKYFYYLENAICKIDLITFSCKVKDAL